MTQPTQIAEHLSQSSGRDAATGVAGAVEDVRLAEVRLDRRRQRGCGPSASMREALRLISEGADAGETVTPTDLAKALRIKGPSATHIVRRLSENGLILALPIEGDGRRKQLVPMDRHLDPDLSDPLNRAIRTLAAGLDERDARTVTKFLASLAELVDAECR